jgi:hypothetical protein
MPDHIMPESDSADNAQPVYIHHTVGAPSFQMDRAVAQDETLTWEARGMLAYILSKPANWKIDVADLLQQCGIEKAYRVLRELSTRGLIPIPGDAPGYVYLIQPDKHNVYKIGCSTHAERRLKSLQSDKAYRLEIVATNHYPAYKQAELQWHFVFKKYHLSGDWFALPDSAIEQFKRGEL